MPPRGSEGLDFTPILTHYVFLLTTILAILGWFIAFIGQALATAQCMLRFLATDFVSHRWSP